MTGMIRYLRKQDGTVELSTGNGRIASIVPVEGQYVMIDVDGEEITTRHDTIDGVKDEFEETL